MNFNKIFFFNFVNNVINVKKKIYLEINKSYSFIIIKIEDLNIFLKINYLSNERFYHELKTNIKIKNFLEIFSFIKNITYFKNNFKLKIIIFYLFLKNIFLKNNNFNYFDNEIDFKFVFFYFYIFKNIIYYINYNFFTIIITIFKKKIINKYLIKINFKNYNFKKFLKSFLFFKCKEIKFLYYDNFYKYKQNDSELLDDFFMKKYNYIIFDIKKIKFKEFYFTDIEILLEIKIIDNFLFILSKKYNIFNKIKINIKNGFNINLFLNINQLFKILYLFDNYIILYYNNNKNLIISEYNVNFVKIELSYSIFGNI